MTSSDTCNHLELRPYLQLRINRILPCLNSLKNVTKVFTNLAVSRNITFLHQGKVHNIRVFIRNSRAIYIYNSLQIDKMENLYRIEVREKYQCDYYNILDSVISNFIKSQSLRNHAKNVKIFLNFLRVQFLFKTRGTYIVVDTQSIQGISVSPKILTSSSVQAGFMSRFLANPKITRSVLAGSLYRHQPTIKVWIVERYTKKSNKSVLTHCVIVWISITTNDAEKKFETQLKFYAKF